MVNQNYSLLYITDAYCGWCYGFSNSITTFHKNNPHIPIEVISGGLFVDEKSLPISAYPHIPAANQRIEQLTGAVFGENYKKLLHEGSMVLNSEDAASGLIALKSLDSKRGVEFIAAIQHAFYFEGKSLSDIQTYLNIAERMGLDHTTLKKKLNDNTILTDVHAEFSLAQQLKVEGYPTLLLKKENEYIYLGGSTLKPKEIEAKINALID